MRKSGINSNTPNDFILGAGVVFKNFKYLYSVATETTPGALKLVVPTSGTENTSGSVSFGNTEISIPSGETQVLSFDVERGAFTKSEASAKAFDMVLTFNFN